MTNYMQSFVYDPHSTISIIGFSSNSGVNTSELLENQEMIHCYYMDSGLISSLKSFNHTLAC